MERELLRCAQEEGDITVENIAKRLTEGDETKRKLTVCPFDVLHEH